MSMSILVTVRRAWRAWLEQPDAEAGQGLVEYGLLIMLIAIVCVVGVTQVGEAIKTQLYDLIVRGFPGF
jgi:hypothetical protein